MGVEAAQRLGGVSHRQHGSPAALVIVPHRRSARRFRHRTGSGW